VTGGVMPLISYGGGSSTACDLDFEADQAGDANGVDTRPGHTAGTVINVSDAWVGDFTEQYALATLGPGFLQLIASALVFPNRFESITVTEWGETFFSEDATFFQDSGESFWIWDFNVNEFVNGATYCVTLTT